VCWVGGRESVGCHDGISLASVDFPRQYRLLRSSRSVLRLEGHWGCGPGGGFWRGSRIVFDMLVLEGQRNWRECILLDVSSRGARVKAQRFVEIWGFALPYRCCVEEGGANVDGLTEQRGR